MSQSRKTSWGIAPLALAAGAVFASWAPAMAADKVYQEKGGLVVVEAEHFASNTAQADHEWQVQKSIKGYSGAGYLISLPNSGVDNNPFDPKGGPFATYKIHINKAGTYYAIARVTVAQDSADPGSDDSIWLTVDDATSDDRVYCDAQHDGWTWCFGDGGNPVAFNLKAGDHVLNVYLREDGTVVDQIGLTTDAQFQHDASALSESAAK